MKKKSTKVKNKIKNRITLYRRRMKFSQTQVALLLGYRDSSALSKYEGGDLLPSLKVALQLAIILRIPVEFLFPELYNCLHKRIRQQEETLPDGNPSVSSHHSPPPA